VSSFEVRYLTLCFFTSNSITFLHLADELIALSFDDLPIIVGQVAPFFLGLSDELLPVSFDLVGVHWFTSLKFDLFANSIRSSRFPDLEQ